MALASAQSAGIGTEKDDADQRAASINTAALLAGIATMDADVTRRLSAQ